MVAKVDYRTKWGVSQHQRIIVGAPLLVKLMIVHQVVLNQPSEAVKSFQKMAEKMADLCRVEHKLNEGNDKAAS